MIKEVRKRKLVNLKPFYLVTLGYLMFFYFSCSKQQALEERVETTDSSSLQINYLAKIKSILRDSLNVNDFSTIDFSRIYKSKDVRSINYFVRLTFKNKKISNDFILLKTDNTGNIIKGKIVHVDLDKNKQTAANTFVIASSLNREETRSLKNNRKKSSVVKGNSKNNYITSSNESSLKEEEEPVGEQTLPDVVVTGYIYDDPSIYYWYCFDDILGMSSGGGGTYSYGGSETSGGGGGYENIYPDETIDISTENADQSSIDIAKYLKCFSLISDEGATFKLTICSDIPVNSDPFKLFDFHTGDCGHTFLQLTKSNGTTVIQQNIGFYPESGWKSIEANGPVASKLVDNAGHEFNASLTVTVDAAHFQYALTDIQQYSNEGYDIDNFNCTDFALKVFNIAAPEYLDIPQYHIPGGMYGELSNTPQGLYNELSSLTKTGDYPDGQITMPGVAGYIGSSHGACN